MYREGPVRAQAMTQRNISNGEFPAQARPGETGRLGGLWLLLSIRAHPAPSCITQDMEFYFHAAGTVGPRQLKGWSPCSSPNGASAPRSLQCQRSNQILKTVGKMKPDLYLKHKFLLGSNSA